VVLFWFLRYSFLIMFTRKSGRGDTPAGILPELDNRYLRDEAAIRQFPQIPQVGRDGSGYELAAATLQGEVPGFQDNRWLEGSRQWRMAGLLSLLDDIEGATLHVTGEFVPVTDDYTFSASEALPPHVDGAYRGLAVIVTMRRAVGRYTSVTPSWRLII
jgi:hypothetical protein